MIGRPRKRERARDGGKGGVDDATSETGSRPQANLAWPVSPLLLSICRFVRSALLLRSSIPGSALSHTEFQIPSSGAGAHYHPVTRLQWRQIFPFLCLRALLLRLSMTLPAPPTMDPIQGLLTRTRCRR